MHTSEGSGKVIWNTMMSLDGFVADPDETMDWAFGFDDGGGAAAAELLDRLGALVVGRRTMDVEDRNTPGFFGGAYTGPFFVLTADRDRRPPEVKGVTGTLVHGGVEEAISRAQRAARGRDVGILGPTVARSCLRAGLIDEIVVFLAPILLGGGVRLHEGAPRRLDLVSTRCDGELLTLTFVPRAPRG